MPNGGQFGSGTGLQLQQSTPGLADVGNAHLSGTLIADKEIYSYNTNQRLMKFGNNPGVNYNAAFGGSAGAVSFLFGQGNVFRDSNVIQNSGICGNQNNVGRAGGVGITSVVIFGNNNTVVASGYNGGVTGGAVFGASNTVNFDAAHDGQNNQVPILIGYANSWNSVKGVSAFSHGVIIDHQGVVNTGLDNVVLIHGNKDGAITTSNTVKIGNTLQTKVAIGAYDLAVGYAQNAFTQISDVTIANSAAEATLLGTVVGSKTIGANKLVAGSTVRIKARGFISQTGTPTLRLQFKIGGVAYLDTGAIALPNFAGNHGWEWEGLVTVRTAGAGGTAIGQGIGFISVVNQPDLDTTNAATTGINTTGALLVDFTATFGTAAPANSITCTNATMEILG